MLHSARVHRKKLLMMRWCGHMLAPPALLACALSALVWADARPPALLACVPSALVLEDARAPALLALAPFALVLADARAPALLACAPSALVLAYARPSALLAIAPLALVRAYARPPRTPCMCSFGAGEGRCSPPRTPCICSLLMSPAPAPSSPAACSSPAALSAPAALSSPACALVSLWSDSRAMLALGARQLTVETEGKSHAHAKAWLLILVAIMPHAGARPHASLQLCRCLSSIRASSMLKSPRIQSKETCAVMIAAPPLTRIDVGYAGLQHTFLARPLERAARLTAESLNICIFCRPGFGRRVCATSNFCFGSNPKQVFSTLVPTCDQSVDSGISETDISE